MSAVVPARATPATARRLSPVTDTRAYLFCGGIAPVSRPVADALAGWAETAARVPATLFAAAAEELECTRSAAAVGAGADGVAFNDSTSRGSNLVAALLDVPPGANVVVDEFTYSWSLLPWTLPPQAHVELRRVPARAGRVAIDAVAAAVDDRTIALSVTYVDWQTGHRNDLAAVAELAHAHGALLVMDAAQSAGVLHLDVHRLGVDFLSAPAMNWLLGCPGLGFLYAARGHAERFVPPQLGYAGVDEATGTFRRDARRHELGFPPLPLLAAARAGAEILLELGLASVERHTQELVDLYLDGLARRGLGVAIPAEPERRAGMVSVPVVDAAAVCEFLDERGVDVWEVPGRALVRSDFHVFNDTGDVARLLDGLDAYAAREPLQVP